LATVEVELRNEEIEEKCECLIARIMQVMVVADKVLKQIEGRQCRLATIEVELRNEEIKRRVNAW
jgi:hypothetical protein